MQSGRFGSLVLLVPLFSQSPAVAATAEHHPTSRTMRVLPLVEVKQKEPLPPGFLAGLTKELKISLGLSGFSVVDGGARNGNGKGAASAPEAHETWSGRLSVQKKIYAPGWVYHIELEQHGRDGQLIRAMDKYAEIYLTELYSERCPNIETAKTLGCGFHHLRFITRWLVRRMLAPPQGPPRNTAPIDRGTPPRDEPGMVFVPAGEFVMGSEFGEFDEDPRHVVSLDAYFIDKLEVSNADYRKCVAAKKCRPSLTDRSPTLGGATQPVVSVSWNDARNYCAFVGKRLPTEAEWEKAARGTDERKWPWGNDLKRECMNLRDGVDGYKTTSPVGSFPCGASPYGALDMAGNAWEWCEDWWAPDTYGSSPHAPRKNPKGPASSPRGRRAMRGGTWKYEVAFFATTTNRSHTYPENRVPWLGFRCAK